MFSSLWKSGKGGRWRIWKEAELAAEVILTELQNGCGEMNFILGVLVFGLGSCDCLLGWSFPSCLPTWLGNLRTSL